MTQVSLAGNTPLGHVVRSSDLLIGGCLSFPRQFRQLVECFDESLVIVWLLLFQDIEDFGSYNTSD
jgi:hypothetical protein